MKKLFSPRFFSLMVLSAIIPNNGFSQVTLPHYEGFDYTIDQFLHSQAGWNLSYTGTEPVIKSGNLTFPGLPVPTGNKISFDGSGGDPYLLFTKQSTAGTKVFFSFIFKVTNISTLNATGSYFAGIQSGTTGAALVWLKSDGTDGFHIGHSARSSTGVSWSSSSYSVDTSILIAGCYEIEGTYNSGAHTGDDKTYLWINPESDDFGLPASPSPDFSCNLTTSKDLADIKSFFIRQDGTSTTPFIEMDELRIGTSWKDVTAEINPPSWTNAYPKVEDITASGFTAKISLNEPGKVYYSVLASGSEAPSSVHVKSGAGSVSSGSFPCNEADEEYTYIIESLFHDTAYDVYFVAEDTILNLQPVPSSVISITTLKLEPPELSAATSGNDVEHNFAITFSEDVNWRSSITDVKVDGASITAADWDNTVEGALIINTVEGNPLLTTSGIKLITVCATGYNDARISQLINHGSIDINKSECNISDSLNAGVTSTVTLTAKDQYKNPVPGYVFKFDAIITDNSEITDEVYTINGIDYDSTVNDVSINGTDASGAAEFEIAVNQVNDPYDGISVQMKLNDGITDFGLAFSYITPGIAGLVLSGDPDETTLTLDIIKLSLQNTVFKDINLDPGNFTLNNAPAGLTIKDVTYVAETVALVSFNYDGTDFDNDMDITVTIAAAELITDNILTSSFLTITAFIETIPSVVTNSSFTSIGSDAIVWGGNVTGDGGEVVVEKGICWSLSPMPDINGSKTVESADIGAITGSISGLDPNTLYFLRAYATNSVGTAYGDEKSFITLKVEPENPVTGLFKDRFPENMIYVYPNPVSDRLILELNRTDFLILEIFSSEGRKILGMKITEPRLELNVSNYKNGLYIIKVSGRGFLYKMKFLKI
jgi:hypothetical protein